jgi:hypothetical protein
MQDNDGRETLSKGLEVEFHAIAFDIAAAMSLAGDRSPDPKFQAADPVTMDRQTEREHARGSHDDGTAQGG